MIRDQPIYRGPVPPAVVPPDIAMRRMLRLAGSNAHCAGSPRRAPPFVDPDMASFWTAGWDDRNETHPRRTPSEGPDEEGRPGPSVCYSSKNKRV